MLAIGVQGLTGAVLHEIDVALKAHELVKIRVANDERGEREAFLDRICRALDCAPVQHLGKLLIVWRHNPELHRQQTMQTHPPPRVRAGRYVEPALKERRDDPSPRSRIAPPSGAPRAPSRRRRGNAAAETRAHDQSRRRRRNAS